MPRMQRYLSILILALLIAGCAPKTPHAKRSYNYEIDALLIQAVYLESVGYYKKAADLYKKAYRLTNAKELLLKSLKDLIKAKRYDEAIKLIQKALAKYPKDKKIFEFASAAYFGKEEFDKAVYWIKKALEINKDPRDLEFLGSIYLAQKRYDLALKYYKSAYALDPSDKTVNTIAYIMYFYLDKKNEAIAYLETHIRMRGCRRLTCTTLASLYSLQNDLDGLLSVYKRLYKIYKDPQYLNKIVEIYIFKKNFDKAIEWAKKTDNKPLLLDLYRAAKRYDKAYALAMELYQETNDPDYLAQAAIYEYEKAKKRDKALLIDVAKKLERAIKKVKKPVYLNYLGYLYIDNDINVQRGIDLVKEALKMEPDSPYYLDSLAWGYYKIKRCKDALRLIKRVYYEFGLKDSEIKLHLKKIEQCVRKEKN